MGARSLKTLPLHWVGLKENVNCPPPLFLKVQKLISDFFISLSATFRQTPLPPTVCELLVIVLCGPHKEWLVPLKKRPRKQTGAAPWRRGENSLALLVLGSLGVARCDWKEEGLQAGSGCWEKASSGPKKRLTLPRHPAVTCSRQLLFVSILLASPGTNSGVLDSAWSLGDRSFSYFQSYARDIAS